MRLETPLSMTPTDTMRSVRALRASPDRHLKAIDDYTSLALIEVRDSPEELPHREEDKLRIAFAARTLQLLEAERRAWHPHYI